MEMERGDTEKSPRVIPIAGKLKLIYRDPELFVQEIQLFSLVVTRRDHHSEKDMHYRPTIAKPIHVFYCTSFQNSIFEF